MLTGTKEPVVAGEHADVLVVTASLPDPSTAQEGPAPACSRSQPTRPA